MSLSVLLKPEKNIKLIQLSLENAEVLLEKLTEASQCEYYTTNVPSHVPSA
jgi:hypothetical protein